MLNLNPRQKNFVPKAVRMRTKRLQSKAKQRFANDLQLIYMVNFSYPCINLLLGVLHFSPLLSKPKCRLIACAIWAFPMAVKMKCKHIKNVGLNPYLLSEVFDYLVQQTE